MPHICKFNRFFSGRIAVATHNLSKSTLCRHLTTPPKTLIEALTDLPLRFSTPFVRHTLVHIHIADIQRGAAWRHMLPTSKEVLCYRSYVGESQLLYGRCECPWLSCHSQVRGQRATSTQLHGKEALSWANVQGVR